MKTTNPVNGSLLKEYKNHSYTEVDEIIRHANEAQNEWKKTTFEHRAGFVNNIGRLLIEQKNELATLMAHEMGKPYQQGVSELEKCAWLCEFYANEAASFLKDESVATDATKSYVSFQPLGVVLSIMPWNFPFWQVMRFSAPALMAGNGVVLKHSENTTGCSIKIEEIVHQAGIPKELFRSVLVENDEMKPIIQHEGIAAVTLTGSTRAGKIVASQAGEALKKTVLELGGSDPYLVLKDADLEKAADVCAKSRLINSGQSCVAAKRFIVVEDVYDEFLEIFKEKLSQRVVGNPMDAHVDIGPLARIDLRDTLHDQVSRSVEMGARAMIGGEISEKEGAFYPVSLLTEVKPGMPAFDEELFGPVAAVIKAENEQEAIKLANHTVFGLGATVFSEDNKRAEQIASNELQAGCCFVNTLVKSDPRIPFGGIKQSGYGRELGAFGIREFVNIKTVWIQ